MQRLARVTMHSAAGGAPSIRDGEVEGCGEPKALERCMVQVCGQVSGSAVETEGTNIKLGSGRVSRKTAGSDK